MYQIVEFTNEEKYIEDFLALPKKLYQENYGLSSEEERQIITGKHVLSKYYQIFNFLVYSESEAVGRCCISLYDKESVAYIGLYECIDDLSCSDILFKHIEKKLASEGYTEICGPVDSSFYIKYRLKISGFENESYFGEPYNLDYYYNQFLQADYQVKYSYSTQYVRNLESQKISEVIDKRYQSCIDKGYEFKTLRDVKYDQAIRELYSLFISTYDVLPIFKHIEEDEFIELFKYFKYIANKKQVQLVYYEKELVAFAIILPNYKNYLYQKFTLRNVFRILKIRFFNDEYIGMYFGARKGHYCTSKAILKKVYDKTTKDSVVIAALMKSDATTTKHFKEDYKLHSEYVLLKKDLVFQK